MNLETKQRGSSMLPVAYFLFTLILLIVMTAKLLPIYFEYYSVTKILKSLKSEPNLHTSTPNSIKIMVVKRMDVNDIDPVVFKSLVVKKAGKVVRLTVDYQKRKPFMYNIDFVVSFNHTEEIRR